MDDTMIAEGQEAMPEDDELVGLIEQLLSEGYNEDEIVEAIMSSGAMGDEVEVGEPEEESIVPESTEDDEPVEESIEEDTEVSDEDTKEPEPPKEEKEPKKDGKKVSDIRQKILQKPKQKNSIASRIGSLGRFY
jgi:outer membrane biosynthesis protein TonB